MKKVWFLWWGATVFWVALFAAGSAFVWLREVDGAGAIQTPEIKAVTFAVLLAVFLIPAIIQGVWFILNIVLGRRKTQQV